MPEPEREDRKETYESAARKMEVDEDYDDEGEAEKRDGLNGQPKQEVSA